jgi:peptide/nickel transport system substrate-binding protein
LRRAAFAARTDLVVGVVLEPPHLDPTAGAARHRRSRLCQHIRGLTRIDEKGQVQPGLAESWTASEDGKTYIFKLRTGVKFHDGSDFNADDVKFSLDRARDEKSTNAQKGIFAGIEAVEVVDPSTVKVTLKNRKACLPGIWAWVMPSSSRPDRPTATRKSRWAPVRSSSIAGPRARRSS